MPYPEFVGGEPVRSRLVVSNEDRFYAQTSEVNVVTGDGRNGEIVNDADTMINGAVYASRGETRQIIFIATNSTREPLRGVVLTNVTTAGTAPLGLACLLPDGSSSTGVYDESSRTWAVRWDATTETGTAMWDPGETITCTSELTLDGGSDPHRDVTHVSAVTVKGEVTTGDNSYNAFSGNVQVIKYDGRGPDPEIGEDGAWVTPTKPLADGRQDANTMNQAATYEPPSSTGANAVRWVVTNTGKTWLTDVSITDVTETGPMIDPNSVVCALQNGTLGTVVDGSITWSAATGALLAPGASFFCQGTLVMGEADVHVDHVEVTATIVVPAVDREGSPSDEPQRSPGGSPLPAVNP